MNPKSHNSSSTDANDAASLHLIHSRSRPTDPDAHGNEATPMSFAGEIWERIGTEFLNAPPLPTDPHARQRVIGLWEAFAAYVDQELDTIYETINVVESDESDPYPSSEAQSADIDQGRLVISRANCDHPVWTPEQNVAFRVWHDVTGHHAHRLGFDRFGELAVYAATCTHIPAGLRPVLFVEVVAQSAASVLTGGFGDQKAYIPKTLSLFHANTDEAQTASWLEAA